MYLWFQTYLWDIHRCCLEFFLPIWHSSMHPGFQLHPSTCHRCIWRLAVRWWTGSGDVNHVRLRWWTGSGHVNHVGSKTWIQNWKIPCEGYFVHWWATQKFISSSMYLEARGALIHSLWSRQHWWYLNFQDKESTSVAQNHRNQCTLRLEIHWWRL